MYQYFYIEGLVSAKLHLLWPVFCVRLRERERGGGGERERERVRREERTEVESSASALLLAQKRLFRRDICFLHSEPALFCHV
jgi:hypothetical protein